MPKPLIIWDWDNTLADTLKALYDAHIDLCDKYGKRHVTREEVLSAICGEGVPFWKELFGTTDHAVRSDYYYKQSAVHLKKKAGLMKNAIKILDWVKGQSIPQVIISNQMQWLLDIECERLGVASYFERIVGRIDALKKPHQDYLTRALDKIEFDTCVVLGDGLSDMKTAQNLGGFGLLVRTHNPTTDMPYDKHVRDLAEALDFLKTYIH